MHDCPVIYFVRNNGYANLRTIAVSFADGSTRQVTFLELEALNWTGQRR